MKGGSRSHTSNPTPRKNAYDSDNSFIVNDSYESEESKESSSEVDKDSSLGEEQEDEYEEEEMSFPTREKSKAVRTLYCYFCQEEVPFDNFSQIEQTFPKYGIDRRKCLKHFYGDQAHYIDELEGKVREQKGELMSSEESSVHSNDDYTSDGGFIAQDEEEESSGDGQSSSSKEISDSQGSYSSSLSLGSGALALFRARKNLLRQGEKGKQGSHKSSIARRIDFDEEIAKECAELQEEHAKNISEHEGTDGFIISD